ncbi:MAG: enoyl-CoA hydratase/isomerase family protein [Sphingomonadales bacterium]|nr:enoyl-CoA hydratase/isomerase family protein [Sphingomonadales bacterium]
MAGDVIVERQGGGITVVTLARPEARNALTLDMAGRLSATLKDAGADPECRVIVLAAQGGAFCAGLDLKAHPEMDGVVAWMGLQEVFSGLIETVRGLPQPVVAAVPGASVGAGFGLALAADIRFCAPAARFLVGAVKVGLSAAECGISYHLPQIVGAGRAFEIMLTGRPVLADEALAIGLASEVVAAEALLGRALDCARAIAENSPYSVKHTKQAMWANLHAPSLSAALELENHVQVVALMTHDFREAATAFAEKRPPNFTGR